MTVTDRLRRWEALTYSGISGGAIAVLDGTVSASLKRSRRCAPGVRSEGRGEDGSMSSQVHAGPQNFAEGGAPSSSRGGDASG
ncbi:hypothetical protein THAOC_02640 [Thalassiosira oceanica]|uniref:Uncharacterized protein n=1 Tax=Thalassiosira oceanica TaxID=159749 RepID=K0TEV9_THAOC|nr:hypothetical protein THAOC_02640 [Thalassiosira oceanica]|eukprot:EJK75629.1 hypothetical protein THAOC_02640 [Thalassiosira oceanica]